MRDKQLVVVHLVPTHQDNAPPLAVRVRRLLKACLRQHGFRCEYVSWQSKGDFDDDDEGQGRVR